MRAVALPPVLDSILRGHRSLIGVPLAGEGYKQVYATNARLLRGDGVFNGAEAIAKSWADYSAPSGLVHYVVPMDYKLGESTGHIWGIMVQVHPDSSTRYARRRMNVLMNVEKGDDGKWRIAAENESLISNPVNVDTLTAASLIEDMDEAGITYGLIAGLGYEFADGPERPGERVGLQAENDWTVQQAARFPGRLVAFCGMNPIRTYAIDEMDRCAKMPSVRGMKLYIHNRVDLTKSEDVEKLREFVSAANARRLPLLVHLSVDREDGARHARIFLEQVVPVAPDIPIQVAHMAIGGSFWLGAPDDALKVYADAAAAANPLMKNLYFDVTGSVSGSQSAATYETLAQRMRTIGLNRILFGSDLPFYPLAEAGIAWAKFRKFMPLTNAELRVIADNVAPYMR